MRRQFGDTELHDSKDYLNKIINFGMKDIFISGYSSDIIHKRGILEEKLDIISKPIMPDELLAKVRKILDT